MGRLRQLLACCLIVSTATFTTNAQTWECGINGNNVTATYADNVLTISGTGAMVDYNPLSTPVPWSSYTGSITTVIIRESNNMIKK